MVTASTPISHSNSYRSPGRLLALVLGSLLLLSISAAAWLYAMAHSALPQLSGALQVQGLSAPVTVTRDAHGVPTIDAANLSRCRGLRS